MMPYRDVVLADRPRAYWPMGDNGAGSVARDISGHGHHGTYTGSGTAGLYDYAVATGMPGAGRSLRFGNTFHLPWPASARQSVAEFSRECWVVTTQNSTMYVVGQYGAVDGEDFWEMWGDSSFQLFLYRGGFVYRYNPTSAAPARTSLIRDGRLHHMVYTRGAARVRVYVDGDLWHDLAGGGTQTLLSSCPGSCGRQLVDNINNFVGVMQHAAIYDYELSRDQIIRHYQAGRGLLRGMRRRAA